MYVHVNKYICMNACVPTNFLNMHTHIYSLCCEKVTLKNDFLII